MVDIGPLGGPLEGPVRGIQTDGDPSMGRQGPRQGRSTGEGTRQWVPKGLWFGGGMAQATPNSPSNDFFAKTSILLDDSYKTDTSTILSVHNINYLETIAALMGRPWWGVRHRSGR